MITCIDDLQALAKRRVPRMFYDYVDSGSWSESTYRANASDFGRLNFRQRVARNIENRSLASDMVGQAVSMPVAIAPTGLCGMQHADGEILLARAAEKFGIPFSLSTFSICSIEDIASHTSGPFWFQLYVTRDKTYMKNLIERAKDAACSALIITLDLQIQGQRHKDLKNGLSAPPKLTLPNILNLMTKPAWCLRMLGTSRRTFGNIVGHVPNVSNLKEISRWTERQLDPTLCWDDVRSIRKLWPGKMILKGILDVEDAQLAKHYGADAIVVSNHGGRQLDGAPSSISALSEIVNAVGRDLEVLLDSGIRSGQDVLKAVALGAKGVLMGRAPLYGLGALGEAGVTKCLEIVRNELDLSMAFCGLTDVRSADNTILLERQGLSFWPCGSSRSLTFEGAQ